MKVFTGNLIISKLFNNTKKTNRIDHRNIIATIIIEIDDNFSIDLTDITVSTINSNSIKNIISELMVDSNRVRLLGYVLEAIGDGIARMSSKVILTNVQKQEIDSSYVEELMNKVNVC